MPGISLQLYNALHCIFFPKSWHLEVLTWKDCPAIDLTFRRGPLPLLSYCKIAVLCLGIPCLRFFSLVGLLHSTERLSVKIQPRFILVFLFSFADPTLKILTGFENHLDDLTWKDVPWFMCFSLKITFRLFYLSNLSPGKTYTNFLHCVSSALQHCPCLTSVFPMKYTRKNFIVINAGRISTTGLLHGLQALSEAQVLSKGHAWQSHMWPCQSKTEKLSALPILVCNH